MLNPTKEQIKQILAKVKDFKDNQESISRPVAELFMLMGIKPEILSNPNNNTIPDDVYAAVTALVDNPEVTIKNDKVVLSSDVANFQRSGHPSHIAKINLTVFDGNLYMQAFYGNSKEESVLRNVVVTTGTYTNGEVVVRTMQGNYRIRNHYSDPSKYDGSGFYEIHEYGADGIEYGKRGISVANTPDKRLPLTLESLLDQDHYLRSEGLIEPISAHMQKDIPLAIGSLSYVTNEYLYYRYYNEIDKLHAFEHTKQGVIKNGLDFNLEDEHGIDNIYRNGVGTLNALTEEQYEARRNHFYMFGNMEEVQKKSPLASAKLAEAKKKFEDQDVASTSTNKTSKM